MNIVLVKHGESDKTYCFSVTNKLAPVVHKGSSVFCLTRRGVTIGTAQTGVLSGEGIEEVAKKNGAKLPLCPVICVRSEYRMSEIKIPHYMRTSVPSGEKIAQRMRELRDFGAFKTAVRFKNGELCDGYTAYLVAKMLDMESIPILTDDLTETEREPEAF